MKQLLEDYRRRLETLNEELKEAINEADDITRITRLTIKRGCYRTFISELEKLIPDTTPAPKISKEEQLAIDKADFEKWRIENDKKNEKFMRDMDEQEEREKANRLPEM